MGDRTFTGNDVIRIFEDFLDSDEQEQVIEFFREEPEEVPTTISFDDIRRLQGLNDQARTPLPGLFGLLLRFIPFALTLLGAVQFATEQSRILINELLSSEGVDA